MATMTNTPASYMPNACFDDYAGQQVGTQNCTSAADTGPDFAFDSQPGFSGPTANGQSIVTSARVNSATVSVSSRDFGGTTRIEAIVNVDGLEIPVGVNGTDETFARLPIDRCKGGAGCRPVGDLNVPSWYSNGIADQFESSRLLLAEEDIEVGPAGSVSQGDGLVAHDEYRGFIYFNNGTGVMDHVRTSPYTSKDVFVFDNQSLLYPVMSGLFIPAVAPGIVVRQLNVHNVRLDNTTTPSSVRRLNRGTFYTANSVFPVYIDNNVMARPNVPGQATTKSDGSMVQIDVAKISVGAFPNSLKRFVVAHELGHKLSLNHSAEPSLFVVRAAEDVGSIGAREFSMQSEDAGISSNVYFSNRCSPCSPQPVFAESFSIADGLLRVPYEPEATFLYSILATESRVIRRAIVPLPFPPAPVKPLCIEIEEKMIMDWTVPSDFPGPAEVPLASGMQAYRFRPDHIQWMCPKLNCEPRSVKQCEAYP